MRRSNDMKRDSRRVLISFSCFSPAALQPRRRLIAALPLHFVGCWLFFVGSVSPRSGDAQRGFMGTPCFVLPLSRHSVGCDLYLSYPIVLCLTWSPCFLEPSIEPQHMYSSHFLKLMSRLDRRSHFNFDLHCGTLVRTYTAPIFPVDFAWMDPPNDKRRD